MGIIKYLTDIGKKKRESKEVTPEVTFTKSGKKLRVCKSCQNKIMSDEKYTKRMGYYFHRKCWKKEIKTANI